MLMCISGRWNFVCIPPFLFSPPLPFGSVVCRVTAATEWWQLFWPSWRTYKERAGARRSGDSAENRLTVHGFDNCPLRNKIRRKLGM